ncbi:MAG: HEAT repeat domain-containing protein [Candidatus Riflebacteria bacterium]|nr:HEAT repeat domain-containing protein [Candidatus Riflebacteria bacterium]
MIENSEMNFSELIEKTEKEPEENLPQLAKEVKNSPNKYFPILLASFDENSSLMTPILGNLFRKYLKELIPDFLIPILEDASSPSRFVWASTFASEINLEAADKFLVKALSNSKTQIVLAAVKALALRKSSEAVRGLKDFFLSTNDEVQLSAAIRYLLPLSEQFGAEFILNFPKYPIVRQIWILKFLSETKLKEALPIYTKAIKEEPEILGIFAIAGLGSLGDENSVKALAEVVKHKEWFLRKRAVDALGQCRLSSAIPPLIRALSDSTIQIRTAAIESLSKIGHFDLDCLIKEIVTDDHYQKIGLIKVFGQIKNEKLVDPLIKTLLDRSTLFFSLDAIGDLGNVKAVPHLIPFLKDIEWFNRLNALEALGKIKPQNLKEIAQPCLEDPNDMVRNSAHRILGNHGNHNFSQ